MLSLSSPHAQGQPASIRDRPTGPAPYSCSPVLKQTHPWRQLFFSQMMRGRKLTQTHLRVQGGCKTSSRRKKEATAALFLPSPAPRKGGTQRQGRRGVPSHLSALPAPRGQVLGNWLSAAGNPSGGEHPHAEPQPDPGREKVTAKPTSRKPSEPAAQTPCQD